MGELRQSAVLDQLVASSRSGDLEAFSEIVRMLHGEIRGFEAMLGVRPDSIDDIAQEVFIAAYRSLGRFEQGRSFRKWLRGVARNIVRQHRDAQEREQEFRHGAVAELVRRRHEMLEATEAPEGTVGSLDSLRRCVARLPDRLRELLNLRYASGMTSQQIAGRMKRTPEAVRMTLMRARRLLVECVRSQA